MLRRLGVIPVLLGLLTACSSSPLGSPPPEEPKAKVVVLGFDGVDPDRVEALWAQGRLPNLKKLAEEGAWARLRSTQPPQSPVAWATFATGMLPGKHGIFDFIARNPATYRPRMGALEYKPPGFSPGGTPLGEIGGTNHRRGDPVWLLLSRQGIEVEVINVPYSFPPDQVPLGGVASGLGVPDLRPTNSTSTVFSTDFGLTPPRPGGVRTVALKLDGGLAEGALEGPKKASGERSTSPLRFRLQEEQRGTVLIETRAGQVSLSEGTWSEWMVLPFELAPGTAVSGQVRFYVESASPDRLHVYSSAVGADPANPFVVLSHPPEMAGMLQERAGRYNTVGWSEDTSALNAELLPDGAFLEDLLRTMDQREKMAVQSVKGEDPHLLISVWTGTDRVAHMFWRLTDPAAPRYDPELARQYGDAIDRVYDRMDVSVGEVRKYIEEDTVLIVLSDHGFHPFHRGVHLNRWLVREGYLSLKEGGSSLADADWSRSRAYALGTGQIYLNLVGREGQGVVSFGEEREVLLAEIRKGLLALKDPDTGTRVSAEVHLGSELYSGPAMVDAPDLQIAFTSGYQASWATRLGGVPAELVERNAKKWSGDHAASAASDTEGVLFVNKPLVGDSPGIEDLAPTLLQLFGKERPPEMDGKPIL